MPTSSIRSRVFPSDKPLPQNPDAERAVLGAILVNNAALKDAAEILTAGDFFHPSNADLSRNGRIFLAMLRLETEKKPIELVTVVDQLRADPELTAYVASLGDGLHRATNVKHYATMVRDKAMLRAVIYKTDEVQRRAWEGTEPAENLHGELELFLRSVTNTWNGHKPTKIDELILLDTKARTFVLDPIFPVKGIAMIYSWRGSGKTFFTLELAYAVSTGGPKCFGLWDVPEPRPVLYVDGEMDLAELQERVRQIVIAHDSKLPEHAFFRFITPDLEEHKPQIITAEGRRRIEDQLRGGELLILDNLSSLIPSGEERETEDWAMVQDWLLKLRRCGYTSLFCHHAGKGGGQRGTSNREDVLNLVINLRRPQNYSPDDGLRAEVHFEKIRGKAVGEAVQPFEVQLTTDERNRAIWTCRPLRELINKQVFEMLAIGMKDREIAEDMRLSRFQVYRLRKKFESGATADSLD